MFVAASSGRVSRIVRLASHESNFGTGESLYYRLERAVQTGESRIGTTMCVDGGMYVLRRELYRTNFILVCTVVMRRSLFDAAPELVANGLEVCA